MIPSTKEYNPLIAGPSRSFESFWGGKPFFLELLVCVGMISCPDPPVLFFLIHLFLNQDLPRAYFERDGDGFFFLTFGSFKYRN